jgi:hypothetical protein
MSKADNRTKKTLIIIKRYKSNPVPNYRDCFVCTGQCEDILFRFVLYGRETIFAKEKIQFVSVE